MPDIGPFELIVILTILFIVFGVGRLPQAGASLGRAVAEFRKAVREEDTKGEKGEEVTAEEPKLLSAPKDE